jgi:hypothetical protein
MDQICRTLATIQFRISHFPGSYLRAQGLKYNPQNYDLSARFTGVNFGSHTREQHTLEVLVNRMARRMCGHKREEEMERWGKLLNEELHSLYSSKYIIGTIKWGMRLAGHVARMEALKNAHRF